MNQNKDAMNDAASQPSGDDGFMRARIAVARFFGFLMARGLAAAAAVMFALIVAGSWLAINRLGQVHFAPMLPPDTREAYRLIVVFVATTTVGIPTLLTLILAVNHRRLMNGAIAIMRMITMIWAIIVTILCLFGFAMDFGQGMLEGFESLLAVAPAVFAMIGGLNLIATVVVVLVSATGSEEHKSVSGAVGGILVWVSEFTLALAGFGFEAYYGIAIGIAPLVASLAALLMSGGFIMSLAKLNDSRRRRDRFDKRVWAATSVVFIAYIGIVGATAGSHLSHRTDLMPSFILYIGERAFFASQGILAVVLWMSKIFTDRIDWIEPATARPTQSHVVVDTPRRPALVARVADWTVTGVLTGVDSYYKIRSAIESARRDTSGGTRVPELPAGVPESPAGIPQPAPAGTPATATLGSDQADVSREVKDGPKA